MTYYSAAVFKKNGPCLLDASLVTSCTWTNTPGAQKAAEEHAELLAKKNPGETYFVMIPTKSFVANSVVVSEHVFGGPK